MRKKWSICPDCDGEGANSQHLGVIDPQDWTPEDLDIYFSGGYDRTCRTCSGSGKVTDEDLDERQQNREDYILYCRESGINPEF